MSSRNPSDGGTGSVTPDEGEPLVSVSKRVESPGAPAQAHVREDEDSVDTARLPRITRMPEGIEVTEERLGQATAQWILEVRCECGRRWFELQQIDTARCPRCDTLVRVKIE
jgi:hypothetical protein